MSRTPKRFLVTGATGFVGRRVAGELAANGHEVVALVRPSTASNPASIEPLLRDGVEISRGDVLDAASVRRAASDVDVVCHLAAVLPRQGSSVSDVLRSNIVGGKNVLDACVRQSVVRLVFASSVAVYGRCLFGVSERTPPNPLGPYGYAKLAVEQAIHERARKEGLSHSLLRLSPIYGRGGPPVFTRQIRQVLAGRRPRTPAGGWLEQWIHVDDAARAVLVAATTDVERPVTFNLAGPDTVSPHQLASLVWSLVLDGPLLEYDRRGFTSAIQLFDTTRSRATLGFVPRVGLIDGLPELIDESGVAPSRLT